MRIFDVTESRRSLRFGSGIGAGDACTGTGVSHYVEYFTPCVETHLVSFHKIF